MLDLSVNSPQDIAEAGYEFEILTPTGDKAGGFITVRGGLSKTVKAFNHKKYNFDSAFLRSINPFNIAPFDVMYFVLNHFSICSCGAF